MSEGTRPLAMIGLGIVAIAIVLFGGWWLMKDTSLFGGGEDDADGSSSRTVQFDTRDDIPLDTSTSLAQPPEQEGTTLNDSYKPITLPQGIEAAAPVLPETDLTPDGTEVKIGDTVVIGADFLSDQGATVYPLITVDDVSLPLRDSARDAAIAASGADDYGQVVQKITMRVRAAAGMGEFDGWNLNKLMVPVNGQLAGMQTRATGEDGCADPNAPLKGVEDPWNTTVKVCFYAYGTMDSPSDAVSNIQLHSVVNAEEATFLVPSNQVPNPGFEEMEQSHDHGDGTTED